MQKRTFALFAKSLLMEKESIRSVTIVTKRLDLIQEEAFVFFHKLVNQHIHRFLQAQ